MTKISVEQLSALEADGMQVIDIRDESAFSYGHIPGALNIPAQEIDSVSFARDKQLVIYCRTGQVSGDVVERLRDKGLNAVELTGGYVAWLQAHVADLAQDTAAQVEQGIRGRFAKRLFTKFAKAINVYRLLEPGDKVAVCISGGKDSMLMAKLFQELKRHNKFPFELVFLVMDPGYSAANREIIERNAKVLNVPITVFETDIFENVFEIEHSPCYICARMRRGHLYAKARELGCNKIALGHHYDDVIETTLMGMLYGGQMQTMMPRVDSANFPGMRLIRPMYLIREDDIKAWRDAYNLQFIQCACKFTDTCTSDVCQANSNTGSKRKKVKEIIRALAAEDPEIEQNIFKSTENVNLSTILAYKDKSGVKHYFYDDD